MVVNMKLLAQQANFGGPIQPPSAGYGAQALDQTQTFGSLERIISNALGIITVFAGLFFIVYFFMAAFKWSTAGGDGAKVGKARDEMVQGVLGLIIIVAAYGIIGIIGRILGLNILDPTSVLTPLIPVSG